jgi:hypothetical protein
MLLLVKEPVNHWPSRLVVELQPALIMVV